MGRRAVPRAALLIAPPGLTIEADIELAVEPSTDGELAPVHHRSSTDAGPLPPAMRSTMAV